MQLRSSNEIPLDMANSYGEFIDRGMTKAVSSPIPEDNTLPSSEPVFYCELVSYIEGERGSEAAQYYPVNQMNSEIDNNEIRSAVAERDLESDSIERLISDEESRKFTENQIILFPRQRAFFERLMPIEWCRERYPRAYAAP